MEINGKKVLTLPQQVLQNQKDIADLKDYVSKKYQHNIKITDYTTEAQTVIDGVVYMTILDNNETPFTYQTLIDYLRAHSTIEFQCSGSYINGGVKYSIIAIKSDDYDFRVIKDYESSYVFGADFVKIEDSVI